MVLWHGCSHRRILPASLWHRQQFRRTGKQEGQTLVRMSVSKSRERVSSAAVNKENGCTEEALACDWAKFQSAFLIMFPMLKSKLACKKRPPLFGTCTRIHLSQSSAWVGWDTRGVALASHVAPARFLFGAVSACPPRGVACS